MATTTGGGWDVFLSHDRGRGEIGNNNVRAKVVADELRRAGLKVWTDDDGKGGGQMANGVSAGQAIADGIAKSKVVVVCVTKNYSNKVGRMSTDKKTVKCLREFNLAVQMKGVLAMLSAVMEPRMARDRNLWSPRLLMEVDKMLSENLAVEKEHDLREAARELAGHVRNKIADPKYGLVSGAGARAELLKVPFSSNVFMADKKARDFAPGTRRWILERVAEWYTLKDRWLYSGRVFVLLGAAAVGKSTLAAYVAQRGGALMDNPAPLLCADGPAPAPAGSLAMADKVLSGALGTCLSMSSAKLRSVTVHVGAIHLFSFDEADRSDLVYVFMSISEQLCAAVPGLARELATVRQTIDANELRKGDPIEAFRALVARPCTKVRAPPKRVVVVIGALDKCSKQSRRELFNVMRVSSILETPDWLGFVITSRPEDYNPLQMWRCKTTLVDAEEEKHEEDMRHCIQIRVRSRVSSARELQLIVAELARRSGGNFLYARFLEQMLEQVLQDKAHLELMDLYDDRNFPKDMNAVFREYFQRFRNKIGADLYNALLQHMVVAREPLPEAFVRTILLEHAKDSECKEERADELEELLQADLNLLFVGGDGGLRFVHKSMADWLLDEDARNKNLGVSESRAHEVMAERLADDRENRFALRHALWHLWHAEKTDKANELLLDVSWLLAALQSGVDPDDLVSDADAVHCKGRKAEVDDVLRVLELGAQTLRQDPLQLASQLYGRLPADHVALRRVREAMPRPWLRPVTPTLASALSPLKSTLLGHDKDVNSVAIHGDTIVSGGGDNTVRVWRAADGGRLHVLEGHGRAVNSVAIEGGTIVSGSDDTTVRVWRAADGECLHALQGHRWGVNSVAIEGDTIVSGSDDTTVRVWRASDGECLQVSMGHNSWVWSVAIQGDMIVSGSYDKTVRVWRAADGECLHVLKGHDSGVSSVAIQGDTVVSGSEDNTVRVWCAADGGCLHVLEGHDGAVRSVAMEGGTIVSGSNDMSVRAWRAADGERLRVLRGHDEAVRSVAIQGGTIVSGSSDMTVRVWRTAGGERLNGHHACVRSVVLQGDTIVSGSADKTVRVWRAADGECLHVLKGHDEDVRSVAIEGDTIVSRDLRSNIRRWPLADLGLAVSDHASDRQGREAVAARAPLQITVDDRTVRLQSHTPDSTRAAGVIPFTVDDSAYDVACSADVVVLGTTSGAMHILTLEEAGAPCEELPSASNAPSAPGSRADGADQTVASACATPSASSSPAPTSASRPSTLSWGSARVVPR